MEAKERILNQEQKKELFRPYPCLDPSFEDDYKTETEMLLEKQDEISFKAGQDSRLKEVKEWIEEHREDKDALDKWQAFLKGLEETRNSKTT